MEDVSLFKQILPINTILFFRFFGLFIVLPLISLYASGLEGSTPFLVGLAIGGYGLIQAIFQIPFGIWSDKYGRRNLIIIGSITFLLGSIIAYIATDIYTLLLGRFLQGVGAIGSVVSAYVSDQVREEKRGNAMAIVGGTIAMSFAFAMIIGSTIGGYYGVNNLFLITIILSIVSLILSIKLPQDIKIKVQHVSQNKNQNILLNKTVHYLLFSSLVQKGIMSVIFTISPFILVKNNIFQQNELWQLYIPSMLLGLLAMGPAVIFGEKRNKPKIIFLISAILFAVASIFYVNFGNSGIIFAMPIFFVAFNLIEPLIQSMTSKIAKIDERGKALGYVNSFAYIGTFLGGSGAGLILSLYSNDLTQALNLIGIIILVISIIWISWTIFISNPVKKSNLYLNYSEDLENKILKNNFEFIDEWYINKSENILVIKFNAEKYNETEIKKYI